MKKIILTSTLIGASLFLQSFSNHRTTEKMIDFKELNETNMQLTAQLGSFEEAQKSHYTGDKGTWSYRYKKWTLEAFEQAPMFEVEKVLTRN